MGVYLARRAIDGRKQKRLIVPTGERYGLVEPEQPPRSRH
jgi:hypothetical protein